MYLLVAYFSHDITDKPSKFNQLFQNTSFQLIIILCDVALILTKPLAYQVPPSIYRLIISHHLIFLPFQFNIFG